MKMIPSLLNETLPVLEIEKKPANFSIFFPFEKKISLIDLIDLKEPQDFIHIQLSENELFQINFEECEKPSQETNTPLQEKSRFKSKTEISLDTKPRKKDQIKESAQIVPLQIPFLHRNESLTIPEKSIPIIAPIFAAIEKTITIEETKTSLSTIQSITYVRPNSKFNGLEIQLEFFDTNPRSINIEIIGNAESVKFLSGELKNLEICLKTKFETIEFPKIALSLIPIFPTPFYQQKSTNKVSKKKATEGKVVFKPIKEKL